MKSNNPTLLATVISFVEAIKLEEPLIQQLVAASRARNRTRIIEISDKISALWAVQEAAAEKMAQA